MHVAFCFNVKKNLPSTDPRSQADAEFDAPETITAIDHALIGGGHKVTRIEADETAYLKLFKLKNKLDIVFNIAEGFRGDARESQIPSMCDMLGIPYTHSSALTQAITLDKTLTKKILHFHGLLTPTFKLVHHINEALSNKLNFPLIIKPNAEGSSKGILNANLVKNVSQLRERVAWELRTFAQPVLIEEFVSGREFTVSLLGNPPRVLPIIEQRLDRLPKHFAPLSSYEVKWLWEDTLPDPKYAYDCPAKITKAMYQKIADVCCKTYAVLNCRDVVRIDIRLDKKGQPQVLEVNTLPGMMPDSMGISYLPISARAAGLAFNQLVMMILGAAQKRYHLKVSH